MTIRKIINNSNIQILCLPKNHNWAKFQMIHFVNAKEIKNKITKLICCISNTTVVIHYKTDIL